MAADAEKTLRLFFALWPDSDTRAALDRTGKWLHRHWEGRLTRAETLHLTLVFLGAVDASRLDALRELAAQVRAESFALQLDQAGCWRHNRVGWLGAGETPPALATLVADLENRLESGLIRFDKRAFVPHITLLRKARCAEVPACRPVVWPVDRFVLVESQSTESGVLYQIVGEWPLASAAAELPAPV
ncbi:MAG: RNA 2',3'-cyclic phosphodiesterase [Thiobacillaceae bacterium]|jgi:2'-5' RNA ligase|nr:RNA 2',3'-cyclic phosphodiesterase [Thiobacillaceae bacterium]